MLSVCKESLKDIKKLPYRERESQGQEKGEISEHGAHSLGTHYYYGFTSKAV